jgi:hypothetical protein
MRGVDLLGAAEEADRRLRIAEPERGPAGAEQRVIVARVDRDQPDVARKRRFRRLGVPASGAGGGSGGRPPIYCASPLAAAARRPATRRCIHPHPVAGSS